MHIGNVYLIGETGNKKFVLRNGNKTKTFYDAKKFDFTCGQYPIVNENNEIVEYMDLMGTFTQEKTEVAFEIYYYLLSMQYLPNYSRFGYKGIIDFPSKYLVDPDVRKFSVEEEKYRNKFVKNSSSIPLFERLTYVHTMKSVLRSKLRKANRLASCEHLNDLTQ